MDHVNSARLRRSDVDQALNDTYDKFINTFVDTLQMDQYSRDCMRPLMKNNAAVTLSGNVITFPSDYRQMVGLTLTIDGSTNYWPREMLYNEKGPSFSNSFTEPVSEYPTALEDQSGLRIYCGTGVLSAATMDYVIQQTDILYSDTAIQAPTLTGLTVGATYYVESGTVIHNSVTYSAASGAGRLGDSFVAVNTIINGTGTVALIQNCQFGQQCHEEMCKVAAAIVSGIIGDRERFGIKALEGKR